MRLINVHTRKFAEFYDTDVRDYAILSHTWDDEEVSYDDYINERGRDKEGFRKIEFLCKQAIEDGLDYVWIDTSCINKSSSAELTEAINSMFTYYRNAQVCYAYLSDLSGDFPPMADGDDNIPSMWAWADEFNNCKWFKRGWTLQELLAPPEVLFYGESWNFIGYRHKLTRAIALATSIQEHVLQERFIDLDEFSVAEKMCWAAKRKTSRIEDVAYCLLGIFGVNMPMLYGEGRRAFTRLQEEIIRTTDDHTIFVWRHETDSDRHLLLAPSPDNFNTDYKIIRAPALNSTSGYSLGNTGLRITLPVIKENRSGKWCAVIGCRPQDDSRNVLALCIEPNNAEMAVPEAFHISPLGPQRQILVEGTLQGDVLQSPRSIVITRDRPRTQMLWTSNPTKHFINFKNTSDFAVIGAYPDDKFDWSNVAMDLSGSGPQYGAILITLTQTAARAIFYDKTAWMSRHLAIVFGTWSRQSDSSLEKRENVGLFGIVQSSYRNLPNACRLAVSRSIRRSMHRLKDVQAETTPRSRVMLSDTHELFVDFEADVAVRILQEKVNIISVGLRLRSDDDWHLSTCLTQTWEPDFNAFDVERLQHVLESQEGETEEQQPGPVGNDDHTVHELEGELEYNLLERAYINFDWFKFKDHLTLSLPDAESGASRHEGTPVGRKAWHTIFRNKRHTSG